MSPVRIGGVVLLAAGTFPFWAALGLIVPAALGGLVTLSWMGVLLGFIWGGLVRVFLVHHVTWSINSVCHIWGSKPFRSHDESRNNLIFGVLALGEGWHNNHHAFPTSARHGLRWWQLDISYLVIRVMALAGLAQEVRIPSPEVSQPNGALSDECHPCLNYVPASGGMTHPLIADSIGTEVSGALRFARTTPLMLA